MNRMVALLNRIRAERDFSWLTVSQLKAGKELENFFRINDAVNLFGEHGVGKTFLAWVWQKEWQRIGFGRIAYFPFLSRISPDEQCRFAIVDNLLSHREIIRDAIRKCRLCGFERVLLITVHAADDQMPQIRLTVREEDFTQVAEKLRQLGYPPYSNQPRNFWDLVLPTGE